MTKRGGRGLIAGEHENVTRPIWLLVNSAKPHRKPRATRVIGWTDTRNSVTDSSPKRISAHIAEGRWAGFSSQPFGVVMLHGHGHGDRPGRPAALQHGGGRLVGFLYQTSNGDFRCTLLVTEPS